MVNTIISTDPAYSVIYLAACAVNSMQPSESMVTKMDLEAAFKMSKRHSLVSVVYAAIEPLLGNSIPKNDLMVQWKEAADKALVKNVLLDNERGELCRFMDKNGIWYMPLKGVVLKEMYPRAGMRQMADNDILFDEKYQENIRDFFLSRGYEAEDYNKSHHDAYMKKPVFNFEMHRQLMPKRTRFWKYYLDVKEKLIKDDGDNMEYHFSDEDFYVFMNAHEKKHHELGGHGIRNLLDRYVFLRQKGETLNWEYVDAELDALGLLEYEKSTNALAMKLFGKDETSKLSDEETEQLEYIISSGTYGNLAHVVDNRMKNELNISDTKSKKAKLKYTLSRLFPSMDSVGEYYPFWNKHRILLPIFYVYRLIYKGVTNTPRAIGEMRYLFGKNDKKE